jgi:hypothetical protein
MRDRSNTTPRPARPAESEPTGFTKPTPARELGGTDAREAPASARRPGHSAGVQTDIAETVFETEGASWTVRVLGRSGRAGERSAPLLLLGFWPRGEGSEHAREATVVGRMLSELTPGRLEEALARSTPPPRDDRRKSFFEAVSQGRRGGS